MVLCSSLCSLYVFCLTLAFLVCVAGLIGFVVTSGPSSHSCHTPLFPFDKDQQHENPMRKQPTQPTSNGRGAEFGRARNVSSLF